MGIDSSQKLSSSEIEEDAFSENDSIEGFGEDNGSVDDLVLQIQEQMEPIIRKAVKKIINKTNKSGGRSTHNNKK